MLGVASASFSFSSSCTSGKPAGESKEADFIERVDAVEKFDRV